MPNKWERGSRKLYTLREAAQMMGVEQSTLRYYCRIGMLHCEHGSAYHVKISEDELALLNHLLAMRAAGISGTEITNLGEEYRVTTSGTPERAQVLQKISQRVAHGARQTAAYYLRLENELADETRNVD